MGAAPQQRKILQIGVIQNGRITEEKLVSFGQTVTIGDGQKNTFVLHSSGLPTRFPLFIFKGSQYSLSFTDDMDGKLSMDGGVVMGLDSVKKESVRQKDGSYHYPVTEHVRGKVSVAGTTILFKFAPAPPTLTKATRREFGTPLLKQLDTVFWGILAVSGMLHVSIMLYSLSLPPPPEVTLEEMPDEFAKIIIPKRDEIKKEEPAPGDTAEAKDEKKDEKKDSEEKKLDKPDIEPKPTEDPQKAKEARKQQLRNVGILKVLGSKYGSGGSAVSDIIGGNTGDADLAKLLASKASGMEVANSQGSGDLRGDANGTSLTGVGDVGTIGRDTKVETAARKGKGPKIQVDSPSEILGGGDKVSVQEIIKKNSGGLQACYETALKLNPTLAGKFYIDFTVEGTGRVSRVELRSQAAKDQGLEDCIRGKVRLWRFPQSEEGATDVSLPIVMAPQT